MGGSIISCNVPTSNFIIWQLMTWNLVVIASVKMTHKKRSFHRVKEGCTLIGGGSSLACCVFNSRSNSISTCQIQYLHILASSSMPCHSTFMSPSMTCWCWKYWRPFPLKSHKTLNQSTSQVKKNLFHGFILGCNHDANYQCESHLFQCPIHTHPHTYTPHACNPQDCNKF